MEDKNLRRILERAREIDSSIANKTSRVKINRKKILRLSLMAESSKKCPSD
jgi:hypothetical protein